MPIDRPLLATLSTGLLVMLAVASAGPAGAQQTFRDWTLHVNEDRDGKLCYIVSFPKKEEGTFKQRGKPAAFVSRLPTTPIKEEVSVQPGYTFKTGSETVVVVDEKDTFSFFTQGDHAWARTPKDDQSVIQAMIRGKTLVVRGTSSRDTTSTDTYSLVGFGAAYKAMQEACAAKPAARSPAQRPG
jgi:hypothetical protein